MTPRELRAYVEARVHPVLCVGPMSRACVDAVVRHADAIGRPIPLIASRRQIECEAFGGGYVEGWSTGEFARYVRSIGGRHTLLCRDHGGPWQGLGEEGMSTEQAMARAKASIAEDLEHGFGVIHLDPSIGEESRSERETLELLFELYAFTIETAGRLGREVEIEVGAEQQSGDVAGPEELIAFLKAVSRFCRDGGYQAPLFCVVQTGTLVREMRNIGLTEGRKNEDIDQRYAVRSMEKNVRALADVAYISGVHVKEHNGDYLSDGSMSTRRDWELGGVNIAPEFGVTETRTLLSVCSELGMARERDALLEIFYASGKWKKWMRRDTNADDVDRAVIAGHYSFSDPAVVELRRRVAHEAAARGVDLEAVIRQTLTGVLRRALWCLGYHNARARAAGAPEIERAYRFPRQEPASMTTRRDQQIELKTIETLGGNVVRRHGVDLLAIQGSRALASGAYEYEVVRLDAGATLRRPGLRSAAAWVVSGEAIVRSGSEEGVAGAGRAVIAQGAGVEMYASGGELTLLLAGVRTGGEREECVRVLGLDEIKRVDKPWGEELWINGRSPLFAFKRITLRAGFRTSLQYHEHKRETNLLVSGRARLHYAARAGEVRGATRAETLESVASIDVEPGVLHRIEAVTDVTLFEVSTPHLDDVIRVSDDTARPDGLIASEHGGRATGAA